jgi:hypothetical protein
MARRYRLRSRIVGELSSTLAPSISAYTVRLPLTARARRALQRAKRVPLEAKVNVKPPSGPTTRKTFKLTLKR